MERSFTRTMIVVLLVIAAILSYVDRGNLSIVVPEISTAFHLNQVQIGWLFSAFFWSYAFFQVAVGFGTDRYDAKWVFAWGYLIWTVATLGTGFVGGFVSLFIMRLLLGAGESVVYPAISRILLVHFPEEHRGLPNALIAAGTKIGPAISIAVGGPIVAYWGWRPLFILTGVISLVWLVPWVLYVPNSRAKISVNRVQNKSVGVGELLRRIEFWGTTIGFFSFGYTVYFLINWLPSYLELGRHFSKEQMSLAGQIPFWVMGGATVVGGVLGDWWIRRGGSPTLSRQGILVGGLSLCSIFMMAVPYAPNDTVCLICLAFACTGLGLFSSNAWAVTQTLAGEYAAGKWSGVQNAIGNLGGAASSILTGKILEQTNSYDAAFIVASLILLIGIFSYVVLVGRIRALTWQSDNSPDLIGG